MTSRLINGFPVFIGGKVVKGFGRGSRELGIRTANFPDDIVEKLPKTIPCGIYFGWANVNNGPVYKMVMSIGWNPFYENQKKSMETHILHNFKEDFYGDLLKVAIVGYIRPEKNFSSLGDLISAIKDDIRLAEEKLSEIPEYAALQNHCFFKESR